MIDRYPVQHPLLRKYIRFFWELRIGQAGINHKIIPQRNINLRFNLDDTPHYLYHNGSLTRLEDVYFPGLTDQYRNIYLKLDGRVHVMGICFYPDGFFPFAGIPLSEFRNHVLGAGEIGFRQAQAINMQLRETTGLPSRLAILEAELLKLLDDNLMPAVFRQIFSTLNQADNPCQIAAFCQKNNIGVRTLERSFNKYVGLSASTYGALSRFHRSMNQLLYSDYSRLSDLAYDNGYFDQMHFIKDFRRFAGDTPKSFINQKNSILQIGKNI